MRKRYVVLALLLAPLLFGQSEIPDTAAGKVFAAWLTAFNSGDVGQIIAFDDKYRNQLPPIGQTTGLREQTGGFTLLRIEKNEPLSLEAMIQEKKAGTRSQLTLEVTAGERPKIVRMNIAVARLTEMEAITALSNQIDQAARDDQFSGTVLVARNGKVLFEKAAGLANRESKSAVRLDTRFRLGSMNKMFTAIATLQLIEAGKLAFDDTIAKHIPEYPNKDLASKVTVRHLLTHTGGTGDIFGPEFTKNRLALKEHADYVNLFGARALLFQPGSRYQYSNYGFVLLGRIIEKAGGMSYYDYVRTRIYEPAGMQSTDSLPETENVANRAAGYLRANGAWASNADTLPWRGMAAGGGYSTSGDLLRFALALESGKLISKSMLAEATTAQSQQYGYGFAVQGNGPLKNFGHSGGAPGMNGDLRIYPETGYVLIGLSNLDPPAAGRVVDFFASRMPAAPPR
jgi:CubicO group peptidase (beta-lactamase class C family)